MRKVYFLSWSRCSRHSAEIKTYFCQDHGVVNVVAMGKIFFWHNHGAVNVVATSIWEKVIFCYHHGVVNVVVLKLENILFCHDCGVVDVVAINVLFMMKPKVNNFFHDHGVANVALKWDFVSFWHYHGVVNVVAKWTVNGVPHDIQIVFPYDHTKNHT